MYTNIAWVHSSLPLMSFKRILSGCMTQIERECVEANGLNYNVKFRFQVFFPTTTYRIQRLFIPHLSIQKWSHYRRSNTTSFLGSLPPLVVLKLTDLTNNTYHLT